MPPHLKKSRNEAHLENGTYEQIVTQLERELERRALEAPDELKIKTVCHNIYLVHKIGTNKTQVLHRMRLRQLTPPNPYRIYIPFRIDVKQIKNDK